MSTGDEALFGHRHGLGHALRRAAHEEREVVELPRLGARPDVGVREVDRVSVDPDLAVLAVDLIDLRARHFRGARRLVLLAGLAPRRPVVAALQDRSSLLRPGSRDVVTLIGARPAGDEARGERGHSESLL